MRWLIIFLFIVLFLSFVKADSVSINPGGDNVVIEPNPYINTGGPSIFACTPLSCSGLGANCGTWSDGCGEIITCGSCSSGYDCNSGICTATAGGTPGGGGTSGGGYIGNVTGLSVIVIIPTQINLKMAVNTSNKQIIRVTNNGNTTQTLTISQNNLSDMVILKNTSVTVAPGGTKELELIFVASEQTGIFKGEIIIGNFKVLVTLDIKTKLLLFDSNILVLNKGYKVSQTGKLKTKVTLIPMGDKERLDVTLNYVIKDYNGKNYLTQKETVLIEDKKDLYRNFDISSFPLGKYIIELELVYPNGVAPSSAQFEIVKQTPQDFLSFFMFTLIVAMIIVSIVIVALSIRVKMRKQE